MSSTDELSEIVEAISRRTETYLNEILADARARGVCAGCAMRIVAQLIRAAQKVVPHVADEASGKLSPTDFDETPGHA